MRKILFNLGIFLLVLCSSISSVYANIVGDYNADMKVSSSMLKLVDQPITDVPVIVTEVGDNLYDVDFTAVSVSSVNLSFKYKNLIYQDGKLSYGANSSIESKDKLTNPSFSATVDETGKVFGTFEFKYPISILSADVSATFSMEIPKVVEKTLLKEYVFKTVPYYNDVNGAKMTKDTFSTFKISIYDTGLDITAPSYIIKLADNKNLMFEQDLLLENISYTANSDISKIILKDSKSILKISEFGVKLDIVINGIFDFSSDSLDGNFSYLVSEKEVPLLSMYAKGQSFDVNCVFGNTAEEEVIEVIPLDFDYANAKEYSVTTSESLGFNSILVDESKNQILISPVKISGISQNTAILLTDAEISCKQFVVETPTGNKIDLSYKEIKSSTAKQFIQPSLGEDYVFFGDYNASINGKLSADNQFIGTFAILSSSVKSIDAKKPVSAEVLNGEINFNVICSERLSTKVDAYAIDSVEGIISKCKIKEGDCFEDVLTFADSEGNSVELKYKDYNVTTFHEKPLTTDTTITVSVQDSLDIASLNVANIYKSMLGTSCYFEEEQLVDVNPGMNEYKASYTNKTGSCLPMANSFDLVVHYNVKVENNGNSKPTSVSEALNKFSVSYRAGELKIVGYNSDVVEIYTVLGTKVFSSKFSPSLNVSLAKGIYLVKLGSITERIVVK